MNLTLNAMELERTKPKHPVLLCLDEFAVLGHMKALESAIGQIAGLDCKLWPIVQDLGQLEALYGRRWQSFMGNCGILQFFGNSDMQTLEMRFLQSSLNPIKVVKHSRNSRIHTRVGM